MSEPIIWGGQKWWLNPHVTYYVNRKGELLHRAVYEHHYGKITPGFHVHHRNEIRTDNRPENLVAMSPKEHQDQHQPRGFRNDTYEQRSAYRLSDWDKRKQNPPQKICVCCGGAFVSAGMRSKFCSDPCRAKHYRTNGTRTHHDHTCKGCERGFVSVKRVQSYCTAGCRSIHTNRGRAYARKKPDMLCGVCGNPFRQLGLKRKTCSKECGYAARRMRTRGQALPYEASSLQL